MISLVTTVLNDFSGISLFMEAMERQSRRPDEIIITDAGSTDGTKEYLDKNIQFENIPFRLKVNQIRGCNVATGRNAAISEAQGDIIVSTDIGCEWEAGWLESLILPLLKDSTLDLVIGSWSVKKENLSGEWALIEWALKGEQTLMAGDKSYSSSRTIAYRKRCWKALGGYPEDLSFAGDDAVLHYLVEKAEVPRMGVPIIGCYWHRHRDKRGFLNETKRYGIGDGEAGIRVKDFLFIGGRLGLEMAAICGTLGFPLLSPGPLSWIMSLSAGSVFLLSFGLRLFQLKPALQRLKTQDVPHPLWKLIVFTYKNKWVWTLSYLKGWIMGLFKCRDCRRRLRDMTPDRYRSRLNQQT